MIRITVDVTESTHEHLADQKKLRGSSISFEGNLLIEAAIKERNRKKKSVPFGDASKEDHTI